MIFLKYNWRMKPNLSYYCMAILDFDKDGIGTIREQVGDIFKVGNAQVDILLKVA